MRKLRILMASSYELCRKGLGLLISGSSGMEIAGEAATGEEALRKALTKGYDAMVLDLAIPGPDGYDVLVELRKRLPALPVLVICRESEPYALRALRAGASGFITRDSQPEELIKALRKVSLGGRYITGSLAESLLDKMDRPGGMPHEALSQREFQVFRHVAAGKSIKQIAAELSLSVKTVSTYKGRILDKMSMETTADLIRYAIENRLA